MMGRCSMYSDPVFLNVHSTSSPGFRSTTTHPGTKSADHMPPIQYIFVRFQPGGRFSVKVYVPASRLVITFVLVIPSLSSGEASSRTKEPSPRTNC